MPVSLEVKYSIMKGTEQPRVNWRGLRTVLVLAMAWIICGAAPALAAGPQETVKKLVEEALTIIQNPALQGPGHKDQRVARVAQMADSHFDYRQMAQGCLGENWNSLSAAQQNEFVTTFKALLKASFACRIDELAKARVSYQPEVVKAAYTEVPITILRPNDKIPVSFRMHQASQSWMIYDLAIEGVSLTDNYRSQFGQVIKGASYQVLIQALQAKLKEEEACKP
jgi:phospholipid transport system substrate-binding protein